MTQATIIDGKWVAKKCDEEVKKAIEARPPQAAQPKLAAVLVGDDPASHAYVRMKEKQDFSWSMDALKLSTGNY